MKRIFFAVMMAAVIFTGCKKDEAVEVKDYGLKTFEADLNYDAAAEHGTVQYKQQTYFSFGKETPVAIGNYGEDSWTEFYLLQDTSAYNVSTDVLGWDLLMSYYTESLYDSDLDKNVPYGVVGVLINTDHEIKVAKMEYTDSEDETAITEAFANLTLADLPTLSYSGDINAIGHTWKSFSLSAMQYTVNTNWFYIINLPNGDTYKLRFTGFYGTSTSERVVKFEYQLMQ